MTVSVQIGLLLALATALTSVVGFLYKHRGAVAAPPVQWRRPVHSTLALLRSRWYLVGIAVALGSWGLHVGALTLAPISLVQSVIAGGLVLLTVVAERLFGFHVTRREWIGVALTATGLAFLAATLDGAARGAHSEYHVATLVAYTGAATLAGTLLIGLAARRGRDGTVLAASAGLLWGASDVTIKALSDHAGAGIAVLANPLALVILVLSLYGLLVSARSLQLGPAVPVIVITSATANAFTIAAGSIVFGEPLPADPLGIAVRLLAFALVIGAAVLTPPPVRAAGVGAP